MKFDYQRQQDTVYIAGVTTDKLFHTSLPEWDSNRSGKKYRGP